MNDRIPARWQWYSKQGSTCTENRDACGIFESESYTFSVVVDASPRGERGVQFSACWIAKVLDRMSPEQPSPTAVLSALHDAQKHLRTERFFAEKASYIALLFPREAQDAYVFFCGDCTLGVQSPDGNVEWLTPTHTLVNALEELGVDADASKRHIVTRTLNARRFQKPDVRVISANASGLWVLATDGYRYRETDDSGHPKDDCSILLFGSALKAEPETLHTNLFVRTSPS
jgi:serine/threonine protein phosphatase PrpC